MSGDEERERLRLWMMAALDGELGASDRAELDRVLASDPELAAEWKQMNEVKEMTTSYGYREPPDDVFRDFPKSVYNRVERGLAWILLTAGWVALTVFGIKEMFAELFTDPDVPAIVKWGMVSMVAGGALLIASVIRERLQQRRHDPYEKVEQ